MATLPLLGPTLLGITGVTVAGLGLLAARPLPHPWRGALTTGALGSALLLLTAPLHLGPRAALPPIALLWWLLLTSATARTAQDRRRGLPGPDPPPR